MADFYREALEKCSLKDKMPKFNEVKGQYECFDLLEQGPCQEDEWFLLRKDAPIGIANCSKLPCQQNKTLIPMQSTGK